MSYVRTLLEGIAKETNRPTSMVEPYIQALEENWYDSKESLQQIDDATFDSLKIPKRVQNMIKQKVGDQQQQGVQDLAKLQQQQYQQQVEQLQKQQQLLMQQQEKQLQQQANNNKMEVEQPVQQQEQQFSTPEKRIIYNINIETDNVDKFINCMQMIYKILYNINENPIEEKFRTLKVNNKKLNEVVFQYPSSKELLKLCKFQEKGEVLFLEMNQVDQLYINKVMEQIRENTEAVASLKNFNAYQTQASTVKQGLMEQAGVVPFYDQLEELKKKRRQVMSKPIKDRKIRCFMKSTERDVHTEPEETKDAEYKQILKETILRMGEEEKGFSSRRKQEFEKLVKQPCYSETKIRLRFMNDVVLEAMFSPNETLNDLIKLVRENLQDPNLDFYLYDTPPRKVFKQQELNQTFDEIEAVPQAYLYFGIRDEELEKTKKYFLKENLIASAVTRSQEIMKQQFLKQQEEEKERQAAIQIQQQKLEQQSKDRTLE